MNSSINSFVWATVQRVGRSFAAALLALITTGAGSGSGVTDIDWGHDLSVAALAGVVTFLLCLIGGATSGNGPAFGKVEEVTAPPTPPVK